MKMMVDFKILKSETKIKLADKVMLIGSCFSENMSNIMTQHGWGVLSNPNGILFNPCSVSSAICSYVEDKRYDENELFYLNELWNSWQHHTRFSNIDQKVALSEINQSQSNAHQFLKSSKWLVITLGSSYQYFLVNKNLPVANNHRAPGNWFRKELLEIDFIYSALQATIERAKVFNSELNIIFTISPVRHIRDGVVANNRSKARLLEVVHLLCEKYDYVTYFPSYEIVIDELRDHRFYDIDLVHPNYAATQYVWKRFYETYVDEKDHDLIQLLKEIHDAYNHKPKFPNTEAHQNFCRKYLFLTEKLQIENRHLNLVEKIKFFRQSLLNDN
jgi:hypothetical protein